MNTDRKHYSMLVPALVPTVKKPECANIAHRLFSVAPQLQRRAQFTVESILPVNKLMVFDETCTQKYKGLHDAMKTMSFF